MRNDPRDPEAWFDYAETDLRRAHRARRENDQGDVMYQAEQCAEKTIKRKLIGLGWNLEKTHNLVKLVGELKARGINIDWFTQTGAILLTGYVADRYPGAPEQKLDALAVEKVIADTERLFIEFTGRKIPT